MKQGSAPLSILNLFRRGIGCVGFLLFCVSSTVFAGGAGKYEAPDDFLQRSFAGQVPEPRSLWLTGDLKQTVSDVLQHPPTILRVRYWLSDTRSAWILDEIGKTEPITIGITIEDGAIHEIKVLIFRESRGWEVRYPFFADQFDGARLTTDQKLDQRIDGISGATLSVRAMKKLARLALLFDVRVRQTAADE